MNIVVLGSGGWGTAAAMLLSDNGHTVALWSHDPKRRNCWIRQGKILYSKACAFPSASPSRAT